jgi:hypothetical protein
MGHQGNQSNMAASQQQQSAKSFNAQMNSRNAAQRFPPPPPTAQPPTHKLTHSPFIQQPTGQYCVFILLSF